MITGILLIPLTFLALYKDKFIRKHSVIFYIIFMGISLLAFIKSDVSLFRPLIQGFLGLSFFYLVMIAGALPKSKLQKKLMSVRKEYSILGFIVITPHAAHYIIQAINHERSLPLLAVIAYGIMIPLFVTSFKVIRKNMTNDGWKKLQSAAHIVYIVLFIHLLVNYTLTLNLVLYSTLFGAYYMLKMIKITQARTQRTLKKTS